MTSSRVALALVLCGCPPAAPVKVTVGAAVLPVTPPPIAMPEREELGCGVFAKDGVLESPSQFRACLERAVAAQEPCSGGSPSLVTLELATALIDGTSGRPDIPRARKLLAGCFQDVSVQTVLAHADDKESSPETAPLETCDEIAQTTVASSECLAEHIQNERAWLRRERRKLEGVQRSMFDAASIAAEKWETKLGEIDYARYSGGTLRGPAMQSRIFTAMTARRHRLERMNVWKATKTTDAERDAIRNNVAMARREILEDAEPEVVTALESEEKAWLVYRDAESDLYEALRPGSRAAAITALATEHAQMLCAMTSEP